MSSAEIDDYFESLDETSRATLEVVRSTIRELVPDVEEGLAYAVPAFRLDGTPIAGLSAARRHLSYLPHSGTVIATLAAELADFDTSKGAVRFPIDTPLPRDMVELLLTTRLRELSD